MAKPGAGSLAHLFSPVLTGACSGGPMYVEMRYLLARVPKLDS